MKSNRIIFTTLLLFLVLSLQAQLALEAIKQDISFAASNYRLYPDKQEVHLTPAPAGKKPFYISHYGRHGSRYLNDRKGYDIPYNMMMRADSLDELTPLGKDVLKEVKTIIEDAEGQWGDLTSTGQMQLRNIGHRMVERFPEVFSGDAYVDAKSTVVLRCMLSMGTCLTEMAKMNPQLRISMRASKRDMWYMNHQDKKLRNNAMTALAKEAYETYTIKRVKNPKLMKMIFKHPRAVRKVVDEKMFNFYLIKTGLFQLDTDMYNQSFLRELFTPEDVYQLWQHENVWWYIQHGACKLNDTKQPYTQRFLLRKIIEEADSCIRLEKPGAQLRFGHETVLLPLTCLLGLNGADLEIADLERLETRGWWGSNIFPMGANIQFIFYRSDPNDKDVVFKVLLNEQEATLPIGTDMAPYYHWSDFRNIYLEKLDRYEDK